MGGCAVCKKTYINIVTSNSVNNNNKGSVVNINTEYKSKQPKENQNEVGNEMKIENVGDKTNSTEKVANIVGTKYKILKLIGQSLFSKVYKVINTSNGLIRAMKVVKNSLLKFSFDDKSSEASFLKTIENHVKLDHPNITKFYEYFSDQTHCYFIMEYIPNGTLTENILKLKILTEEMINVIVKQLIIALNYMHSNNITFKFLSLDKILIFSLNENNPSKTNIKLSCLGIKNYINNYDTKYLHHGDPYYLDPEFINEQNFYQKRNDIWSLGIILYFLYTGEMPYHGSCNDEIKKNIYITTKFEKTESYKHLRKEILDLIKKLLEYNKESRITSKELISMIDKKKSNLSLLKNLDNSKSKIRSSVSTLINVNLDLSDSEPGSKASTQKNTEGYKKDEKKLIKIKHFITGDKIHFKVNKYFCFYNNAYEEVQELNNYFKINFSNNKNEIVSLNFEEYRQILEEL